jgi:hypothetical protein
MPLFDHFHAPHEALAPWSSINSYWVVALSKWLNRHLPTDRFRSFANVHLGQLAEADVGEFEFENGWKPESDVHAGGTATLTIPEVVTKVEATFPDEFAVEIREPKEGMRLVGVIEFVSPANKDREAHRRQIVGKCARYLADGIGGVVVDVVTNRRVNLHNELMEALHVGGRMRDVPIYVVGYRPSGGPPCGDIELWPYPLTVGSPIPPVPLALKGGPTIMVDLDSTYMEAVADHGIRV